MSSNLARAGFTVPTIYGGQKTNRYLLETTGCGVAMFDYDSDGLQDLFFVNGTTLEGFPKGQEPRPHLYRNAGRGRFEDDPSNTGSDYLIAVVRLPLLSLLDHFGTQGVPRSGKRPGNVRLLDGAV